MEYISKESALNEVKNWVESGEYQYTNATEYLNKRIKALTSEWTPLTRDTLPKEGEDVLIQYKSNGEDYMAVSRRIDYNYWVGFGRDICVVAWMPKPEPYKGE